MSEHTLKLQEEYYNYILNGTKRIEIRLNDEKRKLLSKGDTIRFLKEPLLEDNFTTKIIDLIYFENFEQMFETFSIEVLADKSVDKENLLTSLNKFYPSEKQKQYGVCCIKLELLNN